MAFFSGVAVHIQDQDYDWYWALFHSALLWRMCWHRWLELRLFSIFDYFSCSVQQETGDGGAIKLVKAPQNSEIR